MEIFECLNADLILFLEATKRDEALKILVNALWRNGKLLHERSFLNAVLEREKIVSTGIGMGVAIPHAKLKGYEDFFLAIGIQKQDGIDWKSLDNAPVHIIFIIGGPDNKQTEYLQILSKLTTLIKDKSLREKLLTTNSSQEVLRMLKL